MPNKRGKIHEKLKNNYNGIKRGKSHYIYTKVTEKTREIIDRLKEEGKTISYIINSAIDIYDIYNSAPKEVKDFVDDYKEEYGGRKNVVIEAVKFLESQKHREKADGMDLWGRAKEEMNVMLISKKLFTQLITMIKNPTNNVNQISMKNLALDPILWFTGKPIKNLTLEEILNAIKKIWIIFNYFSLIDINKESPNQYYVIFSHRQNKYYSNFWLNYLNNIFNSDNFSFKCKAIGDAYEETLSLTITKIDDPII